MSKRKQEYHKYLQSDEWKQKRLKIIIKRNYTCERCKTTFQNKELQVHHKTYDRVYNELDEDFELVCRPCHEKIHHKKHKVKKVTLYLGVEIPRFVTREMNLRIKLTNGLKKDNLYELWYLQKMEYSKKRYAIKLSKVKQQNIELYNIIVSKYGAV